MARKRYSTEAIIVKYVSADAVVSDMLRRMSGEQIDKPHTNHSIGGVENDS